MMRHPIPVAQAASTAPRVIISLAVAAAIVIGAIAVAIHFLAVRVPLDLAHGAKEETFDSASRMASSFKSVFNFTPQVTVNGTTVVEQAAPVMELATAKQDVVEHYQWSQSWLEARRRWSCRGSTRRRRGLISAIPSASPWRTARDRDAAETEVALDRDDRLQGAGG